MDELFLAKCVKLLYDRIIQINGDEFMKRKTALVLMLAILSFSLVPVPASAHSGRTDANGGHYDHSTWEYHYHHGMSAHSHYDINDDGYLDCPFEFDFNKIGIYEKKADVAYDEGYDKGYNAGLYDGNMDGWSEAGKEYEEKIAKLKKEHTEEIKTTRNNTIVITLIICVPLLISLVSRSIENSKDKEIKIANEKQKAAEARASLAENRVVLLEAGKDPTLIKNIPSDTVLKHIVIPVSSVISPEKPYGDYTIYISPHGSKYHCRKGCGNATKPMHIYLRDSDLTPCKNCVPREMQYKSTPDWCRKINDNSKFLI